MKNRVLPTVLVFFLCLNSLCQAMYQAAWDSLDQRKNPSWYDQARFGIKIHWGPYSVPGWAPTDSPMNYSYAEQYERFYRRVGSPTYEFHNRVYGEEFDYKQFIPMFTAELFNGTDWGKIFKDSGAQYVYMTAKHSDGFCLWPNKRRPGYNSVDTIGRDLYGELAAGVRANGLRMGVFYEMENYFDFGCTYVTKEKRTCPTQQEYVQAHLVPDLYDLVELYEPDLIYADGDWSGSSDFLKTRPFLAWLFNESPVKDKVVINDRWGSETRTKHGGYYVCEYDPTCRFNHSFAVTQGFGLSFGFNRQEELHPSIYLTGTQLVTLLVNATARGGNLEINVGPTHDGRVPATMQERLSAIGEWLSVNGEAIYNTTAIDSVPSPTGCLGNGTTADPVVCFTQNPELKAVYATVQQWPQAGFYIPFVADNGVTATLLGSDAPVVVDASGSGTFVETPQLGADDLPCKHAWAFKLEGLQV